MTHCLVLDIETRIDRVALGASGRTAAPRDMPPPLQMITAIAMLEFEHDKAGRISHIALTTREAAVGGEAELVDVAERKLAGLHVQGGELITFNGRHDLGVMRFALLRARNVGGGGVRAWLDARPEQYRDLMLETAGDGRWSRLDDVAAGLGFAGPMLLSNASPANMRRAKAERDVALTMLLFIHLEAERTGDLDSFGQNLLAIGRYLASRALLAPHFGDLLMSPLFASASRN